ncbi:hypothetical protein MVES1_000156 [Malassezia vespertilionis]|uniref:Uncharacterized protein n=1 Tax=Malassezia vespertilionis TaxID=2020962 RepID=A0A2N1JHG6_9BASI|nr:uncharacterized protein MVES1_000156 [Malassezia vespertilionis]PKI85981.1 hypothetical protein MVES_000154 [Malassezia vespertilionis]WFD04832.1 hypothetical protein MVES1_000156 [Malassezia vespertilionis]
MGEAAQLRALQRQFYEQFDVPFSKEEDESDTNSSSAMHGPDETDEDESESNDDEFDDNENLIETATEIPKMRAVTAPERRVPETVVFNDPRQGANSDPSPEQARKHFMSSKIEKINIDSVQRSQTPSNEQDEEGDADMRANDRKLSALLSTTLFAPGSTSLNKKRKLTTTTNENLARIVELSNVDTIGGAKAAPGTQFGEKTLKAQELGKMPARIRSGIRRAAGERRDREMETQKELGLWDPKQHKKSRMSQGTSTERGTKSVQTKHRERGIGSGIGKYRGGTLHLSSAEVRNMQGPKTTTRDGGKRRGSQGGKRGGGRRQ